jgi:superfamily I DNA/RNA helicase
MVAYRALAAASRNDAEACNIDVTVSSTAPLELNDEQKRAVTHPHGPALVLAGPGTGKTRVLSARIVHLLQKGIDGRSILAVTFSNRAAEEMRGRIAEMRPNGVRTQDLHISTFHSFGMRLLQEQASHFGRTGDFVILDQRDRDMVVSTLSGGESDAETLAVEIAEIKRGNRDNDTADDLLGRYEETLIECNAFDFDDLICKPLELFRQSPELLRAYRNRYTHVLVDEYQDINASQYRLVSLLKPDPDSQLFAIGDPDQAIYGFRGADASFIGRFMEDYPRATVYNLTRSYRCSTSILDASQGVIGRSANDDTFLKGLQSGVRVKITAASSDKSEAEYVARAIETMMGGLSFFSMDSNVAEGAARVDIQSLSDFAVLCRVKEQMKPLVQALENHSIPHQLVGTTPFYREEPFSSVIDMLRMSLMPESSPLHQRLVRKGIVLNNESYTHRWEGKRVAEAAQECFSLLHRPVHAQNEALTKRFIDLCDIYGSDLQAFIRAVYLGSGTDTYREGVEQVAVMTLHAAKGLEFPCVFIVGCEDGLLPFSILSTCRSDVDEERRLLYVGMTRAKRYLMLSHARRRYLYGMSLKLGRSRFIDAVEDKLLDLSQQVYRAKAERKNNQLELF